MLRSCEQSLLSGLQPQAQCLQKVVSQQPIDVSAPGTTQDALHVCSGCDSSSAPQPPQHGLDLRGASLPPLGAANAAQKSQLVAVNVTSAALQTDTQGEALHPACTKTKQGPALGCPSGLGLATPTETSCWHSTVPCCWWSWQQRKLILRPPAPRG